MRSASADRGGKIDHNDADDHIGPRIWWRAKVFPDFLQPAMWLTREQAFRTFATRCAGNWL